MIKDPGRGVSGTFSAESGAGCRIRSSPVSTTGLRRAGSPVAVTILLQSEKAAAFPRSSDSSSETISSLRDSAAMKRLLGNPGATVHVIPTERVSRSSHPFCRSSNIASSSIARAKYHPWIVTGPWRSIARSSPSSSTPSATIDNPRASAVCVIAR